LLGKEKSFGQRGHVGGGKKRGEGALPSGKPLAIRPKKKTAS